ncbi:MAG: hypothetical protein GXP35_17370 [Actinobacteria bacterium]|nr:hypothetical protein [Actinomycetota bacterium]
MSLDLDFDCPRCKGPASESFYGPCSSCRRELSLLGGDKRDVRAAEYEPKMNVTPNQVATKE